MRSSACTEQYGVHRPWSVGDRRYRRDRPGFQSRRPSNRLVGTRRRRATRTLWHLGDGGLSSIPGGSCHRQRHIAQQRHRDLGTERVACCPRPALGCLARQPGPSPAGSSAGSPASQYRLRLPKADFAKHKHVLMAQAHGSAEGQNARNYAAHSSERTSACSRTVSVAFSCLSGG